MASVTPSAGVVPKAPAGADPMSPGLRSSSSAAPGAQRPQASTSAKRVPDNRRRRAAVSCDHCKQRRAKCERASPRDPCKACKGNGIKCLSELPRKQRIYGSVESLSLRYRAMDALLRGLLAAMKDGAANCTDGPDTKTGIRRSGEPDRMPGSATANARPAVNLDMLYSVAAEYGIPMPSRNETTPAKEIFASEVTTATTAGAASQSSLPTSTSTGFCALNPSGMFSQSRTTLSSQTPTSHCREHHEQQYSDLKQQNNDLQQQLDDVQQKYVLQRQQYNDLNQKYVLQKHHLWQHYHKLQLLVLELQVFDASDSFSDHLPFCPSLGGLDATGESAIGEEPYLTAQPAGGGASLPWGYANSYATTAATAVAAAEQHLGAGVTGTNAR